MTREQALKLIDDEIRRAESKHPGWPEDRLRQVVIMCEEAGEALKAALTIIESEEHLIQTPLDGYEVTLAHNRMARLEEDLQAEVVQTAAMAIRWLMNRRPVYAEDRPKS